MIPERGQSGKFAKSVFFEEYNEIDIYIEDTALGSEKIASKIYSRVFDGLYKIDQVFPLGGRGAVVSKFNEEKSNLRRPSLFVIDGDIYHLTGDNVKDEKGLYKLPCYCIENIMIDPNAILSILDDEDPTRSFDELEAAFDFDDWALKNKQKLKDLFIEYAISRVLNPSEATVSYEVKNLVSGADGCLDDAKLSKRIAELRHKTIEKSGDDNYRFTRSQILSKYQESPLEDLDFVSGKDYLFPLLKTRLRSTVKTTMSDLNLKIRLSKLCTPLKIYNCRDYVIANDEAPSLSENSLCGS